MRMTRTAITAQMTTAHGTRLPRNDPPPMVRTNEPIAVDPLKMVCAQEVSRPSRMADVARVMISGLTRNTPTPKPLIPPAAAPAASPKTMAMNEP